MENTYPSALDILLVAVTEPEFDAVRQVLQETYNRSFTPCTRNGQAYRSLGMIKGNHIGIIRCGMGPGRPDGSTLSVLEAIQALKPRAVIMVGIAFGFPNSLRQIGDILVATEIVGYDYERISIDHDSPRDFPRSAAPFLCDLMDVARENWEGANVESGQIISGSKLVANIEFRDELSRKFPKLLVVKWKDLASAMLLSASWYLGFLLSRLQIWVIREQKMIRHSNMCNNDLWHRMQPSLYCMLWKSD